MVVICLPTTELIGTTQERRAAPLTSTVQAPHCAMPQPYLVPVSPICSRIAHRSGVLGSASTSYDLLLTERRIMVGFSSLSMARRVTPARRVYNCDQDCIPSTRHDLRAGQLFLRFDQ